MDKRKNNSGTIGNKGGGRKSKQSELNLIENLDSLINSDNVILKLKALIEEGNFNAIKLYFERRFGKVTEVIENHNITNDFDVQDIFNLEAEKRDNEIRIISDALEIKYSKPKDLPANLKPIEWVD
jgi:hypothetical protein